MQSHYSNDIRAQTHWKHAMAITIGYIRDACKRTMACIPNENVWTSNTQRHWHTEYEHVIRICPKFNTLNNFKLYTQSCSRLRIALKCCLSNLTRTSDDFECDLKKKVNAMEPKCSIDKLWYVFHWKCDDTTSTAHHFKKLKKYALAPNSTNRLTIKSDEFFKFFFEYCTYGYYNDGENFIFLDFFFVKMCWNS